jgi:hypothetical protein
VRWDMQGIIRALCIDTVIKKGPFRLRTIFLPFLKQILKIKIIFTALFVGYGYNGEYFGYIYIYIYPSVHTECFKTVYMCLPLYLLVFKLFLISCFSLENECGTPTCPKENCS